MPNPKGLANAAVELRLGVVYTGSYTRPTWRRALTLLGMKRCLWIREPGVGNGDELAELAVVVEREARLMLNMLPLYTEGGAPRLLRRKEVQVWSPGLEYDARRVRGSTHNWESSPTRTLRAAHPQNSSNTPRCPSVVLWTPCSGVEWGVFERPSTGAGKRHDAQAACEPGVRGRGGVPVHPTRLQTHRTSPAQRC